MAAGEVRRTTVRINDKIYPVEGKVNRTQLGAFERKVTIGDATKDSDDFISSWIISDLSGGVGVERFTASDTARSGTYSYVDGFTPGQIALPPLATITQPTADATDVVYPLGDVPGTNPEFYCAVFESAGLVRLYAWNESTDQWRAATDDIDFGPVNKAVVYQGTAANNHLYIPQGSNGYAYARTDGLGTVASTRSATPTAMAFAVWDNKLWTVDASGVVHFSLDGATWQELTDPFTTADLTLDPARTVRHLIPYYDTTGASRLYVVTDRDVYMLDADTPKLESTHLSLPPHPHAGRAAAVFRPGEDLWISLGGNQAIRYTAAGVAVGFQGPGADRDGLYVGTRGHIVDLVPEFNGLYAVVLGDAGSTLLYRYSGTGWHLVSVEAGSPTWGVVSTASGAYRLWWGVGAYAKTINLQTIPLTPRQALDTGAQQFGDDGAFLSPRFDAGMMGFGKLAVRAVVVTEYATSTEKVTLNYRVSASAPHTELGEATTTGKTLFQFGTLTNGVYPGVPFDWLEFYVELERGGTTTVTPVISAIVLHYLKIRQNTQSFTFTIPHPPKSRGRGGRAMVAELEALMEANATFAFKHGRELFRGWLAGMSTDEDTGNTDTATTTVTILAIPQD